MADAPQPKPAKAEAPAPSREERFTCWFTILAGGSFSSALVNSNILSGILFPFLLGRILFFPGQWQPTWIREQGLPDWYIEWGGLIAAFMGPGFYVFHLIATDRVCTRRGFIRLMLILAIVVFVNVLACWNLGLLLKD